MRSNEDQLCYVISVRQCEDGDLDCQGTAFVNKAGAQKPHRWGKRDTQREEPSVTQPPFPFQ